MARIRKDKREGRMIHVRIPLEVHRRVRLRVAEEDSTIQDWVAALVEKEVSGKTKGKVR